MQSDPHCSSRFRQAALAAALLTAGLVGWPPPVAAQGLVPVGEPFEIRPPFVDYNPHGLDVAMARDTGSFVVVWDESAVVWNENGVGSPSWLVRASRFDRNARPLDAMPLDANPSTKAYFSFPARVAVDARGAFLVAWSGAPGTETLSIWNRRFLPDGVAVAPESRLNGSTSASLDAPSVAMAPDGQFVAAWVEWGSGVWFQKYDANAQSMLGGDQPLPIEGVSPYDGFAPTVAIDPEDGSFVVVRQTRQGPSPADAGCISSRWGVDLVGRRYSASGEEVGPPFFVLPPQAGGYLRPKVSLAPLGSGEFVAAWAYGSCTGTQPSLPWARIIRADGSLGEPFALTTEAGAGPAVAACANGSFVAAWAGSGGATVRQFDRTGAPVGGPTLAVPGAPAPLVACDSTGRAVLVWQTVRVDSSGAYEHRFLGQLLDSASVRRVGIDIRPGTTPNTIALGSNGVVPVAILSDAEFDATSVDPLTVTLASAQVRLRGNGTPMASIDDVNGDGLDDLVVQVSTSALALTATDTTATLEGSTASGQLFEGSDSVRILR